MSLNRKSDERRFWAKVEISGDDQCWSWKASTTHNGYGQVRFDGTMKRAHRISWILAKGPIPPGMLVCHSCDNRRCVNPNHLWLGSAADNTRDMLKKGRDGHGVLRGERVYGSKLTEEDVRDIRAWREFVPNYVLADLFGISLVSISCVINRKTWSHVQ